MAPGFTFEMSGINISPGTIQINGVELSGNQGTQSTNVEPGVNVSGETTASNQPQVCVLIVMLRCEQRVGYGDICVCSR